MVVFIPDMKKEVVEKLLSLFSNKWEEVEIDHSLRQAAKLLTQFSLVQLPETSEFEATHVCVFFTGQELLLERRVCWITLLLALAGILVLK